MAFRPGSQLLASSNWSGEVKLWNATTQKLQAKFQAHDQNIPCIAFSPDGQFLATASADGSVKVWDVSGSPATPIVEQIGLGGPSAEVKRLADVLKRNHAPPSRSNPATGMRLYMRDLVEGRTTLIADASETRPALRRDPGLVARRPADRLPRPAEDDDWRESRIIVLEGRDGRPSFRDLGAGC